MKKSKTIIAAACLAALAAGCTTEIDEDAYRAGAIQVEIDEVTSDELYPTAGDEIDWKMVFVPTPGDITVKTFWDQPLEIFNVEVGVYDRFGIPVKVEKRKTGGATLDVKTFVPESGLHFIKANADSGHSIYSIVVQFETNYEGFEAPSTAPSFDAYLDFDSEVENKADAKGGKSGGGKSGGGGNGGGGNGGGAEAAAPAGGGMTLPAAAAGGLALPSAAAGGVASPGGSADAGPTIVKGGGGGSSWSSKEVKTLDNNAGAVSNSTDIKPICADIKGKYTTVDAEVMSVSTLSKGTQIKLDAGRKQGVKEGAVGEIYVDGKILSGGRFRVDKILDTSCTCTTNAPAKLVKKASRFVIKVPE